jgi:hypothetical protein
MQALRIASFMNRPTLLTIQTLVMMGPYLTNSGKFLDASALFGLTVRLAQSVGCEYCLWLARSVNYPLTYPVHRDPHQVDPPLSSKDITTRKSLWWWMLQMDQHYSMALGRPLAMSSIGECAAPEPITPDPLRESLSNYMTQFTSLGREILSAGYMSNDQIDRFTDDLLSLKETLPSLLQFDETWLNQDQIIPGWPLDSQAGMLHAKTHNFLILLNHKRIGNSPHINHASSTDLLNYPSSHGGRRGRAQVLQSCRALLAVFQFFKTRVRASMMAWTMGQMAFNAAMILTLSMLETKETTDLTAVQLAYSTFIEMNKLGIHKLAGAAVEKLGSLLKDFDSGDMIKEKFKGHEGMLLLEDPNSQVLSSRSFSPLNDERRVRSILSERSGKRRSGGGRECGGSLISPSKSVLAQKRRAHRKPYPGRDGRSRVPPQKSSLKTRSPFRRSQSRELSPKKSKHELPTIDAAQDFTVVPQTPSYDFLSPTLAEPVTRSEMFASERVYQPFQPADFDSLGQSPQQLTFDRMIQSPSTNGFLYTARPPPFPPQNTPTDPHMQPLNHQDPQMVAAGLLELTNFQPTAEQQQQLMNFNLDNQGYLQNPSYANTHFEMTPIPVTFSPPY